MAARSVLGRWRSAAVLLLLGALTLAVYMPAAGFDFLSYDDSIYITQNPRVKAGLSIGGFTWSFTGLGYASNWHPVTWLSHMLDVELFGLSPRGHHLVNVGLHLGNALILCLLFLAMTGAVWPSALAAAFFAVHPLHVESVAWVAERKDLLSTFFGLLAAGAYLRYARRPGPGRYLLSLILFALGLMAKPTLVTFPIVLLILDGWPLGRWRRMPWPCCGHPWPLGRWRRMPLPSGSRGRPPGRGAATLLLEKVPFAILSVASSLLAYLAQKRGGAMEMVEHYPLAIRAGNALVAYVSYIRKTIWPAGLAFFYPHPGPGLPLWRAAAAAIVVSALSVVFLGARRRYPYLAAGWLWFLATLVPVLGLVQVGGQSMADRYTYLPLTGLFVMAAWGLADMGRARPKLLPALCAASVAVISALAVASRVQAGYWRDSVSLYRRGIEAVEGNWLAHNNFGQLLYEQGRVDDAAAHFREALHYRPAYATAHYNLGNLLYDRGKPEEAAARYREAIRLNPLYLEAYVNLGNALTVQGSMEEAVAAYRKGISVMPGYAELYNNLGVTLHRMDRQGEALAAFLKALELKPGYAVARYNVGLVMELQGRSGEAAAHYREALRLDPGYTHAREALLKVTGSGSGRQ